MNLASTGLPPIWFYPYATRKKAQTSPNYYLVYKIREENDLFTMRMNFPTTLRLMG